MEILLAENSQLVDGLRRMYQILLKSNNWPGLPLAMEPDGSPLTHDILERLNVLHISQDDVQIKEPLPVNSPSIQDLESSNADLIQDNPQSPQLEHIPLPDIGGAQQCAESFEYPDITAILALAGM